MGTVTVREPRSKNEAVIDRVQPGERVTVTRSGRLIAELRPLPRKSPAPEVLLQRWRSLPRVDLNRLRDVIDLIVEPSLISSDLGSRTSESGLACDGVLSGVRPAA